MTAYCTVTNLLNRYGSQMLVDLPDRADPPAGVFDTAVIDRAIQDAQALINGYISAVYQPLTEVPALVADVAQKLVIWNLHIYSPPDKIKADYDGALRLLREIAAGTVRIPGAAGLDPAARPGTGAKFTDRARPITPENMTGFI